jgi:uncharacterized ferritin-like protein (DUF455 family)
VTLAAGAVEILATAEPGEKSRLTRSLYADWKSGRLTEVGHALAPSRPARPARPELKPPRDMPKRSTGGVKGLSGLLHALAHIELNAIDLAWDIVARFSDQDLPQAFFDDWARVAFDEAAHFDSLAHLLSAMGCAYGDFPAHDGLWQAAEKTSGDLMDRLALVPMTLEARGLDTTPATIAKLERDGHKSAIPPLTVILADEIRHVGAGTRWFRFLCEKRGIADPAAEYRLRLAPHFPQGPRPPFNVLARAKAGQSPDFYDWASPP